MVGIVWRAIVSTVLLFVWGIFSFGLNTEATLSLGQVAGRQFENSDTAFAVATGWMKMFSGFNSITTGALVLLLILVWWKPASDLVKEFAALALLGIVMIPQPAKAYYDKNDYSEYIFVLPNESAFFIPDVGANKDSQAKFGSEDYLRENKIAAKRFQIPHAKAPGSGAWSDFYVPSGRLIILDRTQYSREWVTSAERGTSKNDEGLHCQSSEGLDVTVGMAIGASVYEENAPKFLYRFGVKAPVGDRKDPQVIFTSVYYAKSLTEVMDGPVRHNIQTLACSEFTKRTLDQGNKEAEQIQGAVTGKVKTYLDSVGITMDFIGWADTFNFDPKVQDAINRRYIADKDAAIASVLDGKMPTIQAMATAEATRTLASKWTGALPSSLTLLGIPQSIMDWVSSSLTPAKAPSK